MKLAATLLSNSKIVNTPPNSESKARFMLSLFCIVVKVIINIAIKQKKKKSYKDWKPRSKTVLFTDDVIIYVKNPNQPIKKAKTNNLTWFQNSVSLYKSLFYFYVLEAKTTCNEI